MLDIVIKNQHTNQMKERVSNIPKPQGVPGSGAVQDAIDLPDLAAMSRAELEAFTKRLFNAGWGVAGASGADLAKAAVMSSNEVYDAIMLKAAALALCASDWKEFKDLAGFWAERERGKPQQSIDLTQKVEVVLSVEEAAKRIAFAMNQAAAKGITLDGEFSKLTTAQPTSEQ